MIQLRVVGWFPQPNLTQPWPQPREANMADYEGDSENRYCSRCKTDTRQTCVRGSRPGTVEWHCDACSTVTAVKNAQK